MMWFGGLIVLAAMLAIFATMPAGQRVLARLGLRGLTKGAASDDDLDFLLKVCNGDHREVARRLDAARSPGRELAEAELYRRAIRTWFQEKDAREKSSSSSSS